MSIILRLERILLLSTIVRYCQKSDNLLSRNHLKNLTKMVVLMEPYRFIKKTGLARIVKDIFYIVLSWK